MLFYERVEPQQKTECGSTGSSSAEAMEVAKEEAEVRPREEVQDKEVTNRDDKNTMTEGVVMGENEREEKDKSTTEKPELECDIDDKVVAVVVVLADKGEHQQQELMESNNELEAKDVEEQKEDEEDEAVVEKKPKLEDKEIERSLSSGICKELEDWIWQDNKNFLQDVNIFEHTYFK